jgi:hypothetical protein
MRRIRWVVLSVAALLATGAVTVPNVAASATVATVAGSCEENSGGNSCSLSVRIPKPNVIFLEAGVSPQIAGTPISMTWTLDCDGNSTPGSAKGEIPEPAGGTALVETIPLDAAKPSSCSMQAKADITFWTGSGAPDLTVQIDYIPEPAPAPVAGQVRGLGGMCLTDSGNSAAARTKVVVSRCSSANSQWWTLSGGELRIHGHMCVNAKGNAKSGSKVILWSCTGTANEIWVHRSNGEYALKANGYKMCLDDPRSSTANGTQLIVYTCANARNQRWSLP